MTLTKCSEKKKNVFGHYGSVYGPQTEKKKNSPFFQAKTVPAAISHPQATENAEKNIFKKFEPKQKFFPKAKIPWRTFL